jgi:hypothetical protein
MLRAFNCRVFYYYIHSRRWLWLSTGSVLNIPPAWDSEAEEIEEMDRENFRLKMLRDDFQSYWSGLSLADSKLLLIPFSFGQVPGRVIQNQMLE